MIQAPTINVALEVAETARRNLDSAASTLRCIWLELSAEMAPNR